MHLAHIIKDYGETAAYLVTFVWTALEGETFVIFAGLAAQQGLLNIGILFMSAWLGSMCGDQVFFVLGRVYGSKLLEYFPRLKPGVDRAILWLEKYAVIFILSYRFMYGLRNVSGVAVGMSHLKWKKFAILNALAAFLWALTFVGFGYLFGDIVTSPRHHRQEAVENNVRNITLGILGLFFLIILAKLALIRFKKWQAIKRLQD